jgi:hypothetical protein
LSQACACLCLSIASNCFLTTTSISPFSRLSHSPTTYPALAFGMRSKFKDEHPFGQQDCHPFFQRYLTHLVQRSAKQRQSVSDKNIRIVFRSVSALSRSREIPVLSYVASSSQVICEKADRTDIPTIDKKKYLVPSVSFRSLITLRLLRNIV